MLREQGVEGLVIDDEADFKDFLENNHQYWDYVDDELLAEKHGKCRVTFYLEESESGFSTLAQVRIALGAQEAASRIRAAAPHDGKRGGRRLGEQLEAVL